jgi:hypothetical protein
VYTFRANPAVDPCQMGYTGLYSIETEQQGDPYDNVQKVYAIVVANI